MSIEQKALRAAYESLTLLQSEDACKYLGGIDAEGVNYAIGLVTEALEDPTWNHLFGFGFSVDTNEPEGRPTGSQVRKAILNAMQVPDDELLENIGAPVDTDEVLP